ncbi:hypothetical protein HDU88_005852 [Geranomyces variabilis]|nr:hypothetical protein HDU88_005852 [Geranomyces variabilis]
MSVLTGEASPMKPARQGREKQVYNADGGRVVVGVVPIIPATRQIVLVTSRKHTIEWLLPKGGWESDETQAESATREAYEEAGISGRIGSPLQPLGTFPHTKTFSDSGLPTCDFVFFEMQVSELAPTWPEASERDRQAFTYEAALGLLSNKPYMKDALQRCSLAPKIPP